MPNQTDLPLDTGNPDSTAAQSNQDAKADAALYRLFGTLNSKLSEYVSKRYDKEREWTIALRQYSGLVDSLDDKKLAAMGDRRVDALPAVNITRPKTNIAIARLQDIQFPVSGDFNFHIRPTPSPEMQQLAAESIPMPNSPDGATVGDVATSIISIANDRAHKMELKIQDRFVESSYGKRARKSMEQLCILGTGVLKAPVLSHRRRKAYQPAQTSDGGTIQALSYAIDIIPTIQWVDVLNWFPDPSAREADSIKDSFELHSMTSTELRNLHHNPAFMPNRLRKVLKESPVDGQVAQSNVNAMIGQMWDSADKRYAVMEYHGPMDKDVLFELDLISEQDKDDPLVIIQGEVWFVNNEIIRVSVAPLEGEETIPYFICTWEDDPASVFGHGVPYLMRHAARVINSSWLMLLDNAGLTAGPQIVLNKEMIVPANPAEGWTIKPMKVWFMTEYGADVSAAMQFVNVPTQQEPITNIIELALQFADIESSLPAILQGEVPSGNNTFGGLAMVMSSSHIIQQRISEKWDDYINLPIVERFFHYEMQYGEDESIKGDFEPMVGGATARIDKQIRAQDIERILGLAGTNPAYMQQVDLGNAFREWVATTRAGDILKSPEQVAAEQQQAAENPPPDPALISAQAEMMRAEVAKGTLELDQKVRLQQLDIQAQVEEAKVDKENRDIVAREHENQIKLQIAQMDHERELNKAALAQGVSQAEIAAKLNISVMSEETKRLNKQVDLDKFNTEIKMKREMGEGI